MIRRKDQMLKGNLRTMLEKKQTEQGIKSEAGAFCKNLNPTNPHGPSGTLSIHKLKESLTTSIKLKTPWISKLSKRNSGQTSTSPNKISTLMSTSCYKTVSNTTLPQPNTIN
jgi:hypothetical protein